MLHWSQTHHASAVSEESRPAVSRKTCSVLINASLRFRVGGWRPPAPTFRCNRPEYHRSPAQRLGGVDPKKGCIPSAPAWPLGLPFFACWPLSPEVRQDTPRATITAGPPGILCMQVGSSLAGRTLEDLTPGLCSSARRRESSRRESTFSWESEQFSGPTRIRRLSSPSAFCEGLLRPGPSKILCIFNPA